MAKYYQPNISRALLAAASAAAGRYGRKRKGVSKRSNNKKMKFKVGFKHKGARSRTKTKVSQKKALQDISQHNDLSRRILGVVKTGKQIIRKTEGLYRYRNMNQLVMTGTQGRQMNNWPEAILTRNNLIGITSDVRSNKIDMHDDLYLLNPYNVVPASTIYPGPHPTVPDESLLYVKSVKSHIDLLSMVDAPMVVTVYWVTPKHDTNLDPKILWDNSMANAHLGQVGATNATSTANLTAVAGGATNDNWGENPFSYKDFRSMYKCLKKAEVVLQPGDQRNYDLTFAVNSIYKRGTFLEMRVRSYLAGITIFPMIIAKAGLCGISVDDPTDSVEVSYATPKVGVVHNSYFTFGALPATKYSTSRVYKGIVEADTTESLKQVDVVDNISNIDFV